MAPALIAWTYPAPTLCHPSESLFSPATAWLLTHAAGISGGRGAVLHRRQKEQQLYVLRGVEQFLWMQATWEQRRKVCCLPCLLLPDKGSCCCTRRQDHSAEAAGKASQASHMAYWASRSSNESESIQSAELATAEDLGLPAFTHPILVWFYSIYCCCFV